MHRVWTIPLDLHSKHAIENLCEYWVQLARWQIIAAVTMRSIDVIEQPDRLWQQISVYVAGMSATGLNSFETSTTLALK